MKLQGTWPFAPKGNMALCSLQGTWQRPKKRIRRQILLINPKLCIKDRLGNLFTGNSIRTVVAYDFIEVKTGETLSSIRILQHIVTIFLLEPHPKQIE
jgi:hypothetical protein